MKEMHKKIAIVWFKNDLRLLDNESLVSSITQSDAILPVYIFDPRHYKMDTYAFAKAGYNRFQFLCQTVVQLRANLLDRGANLLICVGNPEEVLPALTIEHGINTIFAEEEYASEELEVIKKVKQSLPKGVALELNWGKTLYHKDDIPYAISEIPMTSKAFRINTTKKAQVRATLQEPNIIKTIAQGDWGLIPKASEFGLKKSLEFQEVPYVKGGEQEALMRLDYYTIQSELLTSYKWTRNRSLGLDYSSKLSPYLAVGAISPRTIYFKVKEYESTVKKNISTWWLIFEVVWRDFFTFKGMRMGNAIFNTAGYKNKKVDFKNNEEYFKKWCNGTTGIPFIDAHMRQLNETGYMSNRGRVNCASYFVHDLKIDWTWGAAYFESKLIDYDVSANWMNWHMQAYEIWYTNPVNQSIKYKSLEYIQKWIPELAHITDEMIYIPWKQESPTSDYPMPIEVYAKWSRAVNKILKAVAVV